MINNHLLFLKSIHKNNIAMEMQLRSRIKIIQ